MCSAFRKLILAALLGAVCLTVADSAPVIVPPPGGGVIGFPAPCGADGKIPKQSAGIWVCADDTGAGTGAPTDATYITQTANGTLTGEQALSALTSGLLLNTTGTGVLSIYGGSGAVANQFLRSVNAAGVGSHSQVGLTDLNFTPLTAPFTVAVVATAPITLSGEQTIDGVVTAASRVLVMAQSDQTTNGIYLSAAGAWTRTTDFNVSAEFQLGTELYVLQGTTNAGTTWTLANTTAPTLGTSPLSFTRTGPGSTALRTDSYDIASGVPRLRADVKLKETEIGSLHTHTALSSSSSVTVQALTEGLVGTSPLTDLISSPQIAAGVAAQLALFPGTDPTNTVKFDNGAGLRLCGNKGSTIVGLNGEKPLMVFNATLNVWEELICPSLQKAYNTERTIYTATDAATAVQIGSDAANHTKFYGSTIEGVCSGGACDQVLNARTGKTLQTTYSDAGTPCTSMTDAGVITYSNNCKPRKSVSFGASAFETDGTVCTDPVTGTVNGSKMQVIACTDPGADTPALEFDLRMPDSWDGLTITLQTDWFSASNLSAQHVDTDWNGVCVRSGDVKPAPNLTNVVAAVTTFGNQANDERMTTTAAITLNGTCAGGAHVYLRGRMLAATTAVMTNVRFLGAKLEYQVNAFSD